MRHRVPQMLTNFTVPEWNWDKESVGAQFVAKARQLITLGLLNENLSVTPAGKVARRVGESGSGILIGVLCARGIDQLFQSKQDKFYFYSHVLSGWRSRLPDGKRLSSVGVSPAVVELITRTWLELLPLNENLQMIPSSLITGFYSDYPDISCYSCNQTEAASFFSHFEQKVNSVIEVFPALFW